MVPNTLFESGVAPCDEVYSYFCSKTYCYSHNMGNIKNKNSLTSVKMRFSDKRICAKLSKSFQFQSFKKFWNQEIFNQKEIKV